jgi:Protein of unknown function (DUF2840)
MTIGTIFKARTKTMNDIHGAATGATKSAAPQPRQSDSGSVRATPLRLTTVQTLYREGRQNYRVLFGEPLRTHRIARAQGFTVNVWSFAPGVRFALDLWACNRYGTIRWRCYVCEAIGPGEEGDRVPLVAPAAKVLLHTQGAAQSRLFLAWLRELDERGVDPLTCPRETFEAAHFRLHGSRADKTAARRLSGYP